MVGFFERVFGTIKTFFQIGGPAGPGINAPSASALEAKDPTNTTFVNLRGADPVGANDFVNLEYLNNHALLQDGNSFGSELFAGTNDNFPASFGAFSATGPSAFVTFTPNGGVAPVVRLDTLFGASGIVDVGVIGAITINVGNNNPPTALNLNSGTNGTAILSEGIISLNAAGAVSQVLIQGNLLELTANTGPIVLAPNGLVVSIQATPGPTAPALRFYSGPAINYVGFKAPDGALLANTVWTLPSADGSNGQVLTTNGTAGLSWMTPGAAPGAVIAISYNITNIIGPQSSVSSIPANALVLDVKLNITTPFAGGATIEIGQTGSLALLMATGDNDPQAVAGTIFEASQATSWGGASLPVVTTVAGGPGAGAATVTVLYAMAIN